MVSVVSSFKRGGWDSFPYVVVLGSCVGCSSSMTSPWLVCPVGVLGVVVTLIIQSSACSVALLSL